MKVGVTLCYATPSAAASYCYANIFISGDEENEGDAASTSGAGSTFDYYYPMELIIGVVSTMACAAMTGF